VSGIKPVGYMLKFALDWFVTNDPYKLTSAKTVANYLKAINKCKKDYRSVVSLLNSRLNTVEIYQCSHQWSRIDPKELNLHSLKKYHQTFFSTATVNEMNTPIWIGPGICPFKTM
jgi:hypothetical protein